MKIVSFNVNGIRSRFHQLEALVKKHSPEIIGLQEIKVQDMEFPIDFIHSLGYHVEIFGQKGHYGVALMSKKPPVQCIKGLGNREEQQRRMIQIDYEYNNHSFSVFNGYFPQGENRSHPTKFPLKEIFFKDLLDRFTQNHQNNQSIFLMGDMNVSCQNIDIGIGEKNRLRWLKEGKCSFLPEEREWLSKIYNWGFYDTFRHHYPDENNIFSWFDYRSKGFNDDPKRGLRIDLILATKKALAYSKDSFVDYELRGMEKPSDHAPVICELNW